ncbi:MAG: tetratricopeptide repeat protein, partial [Rhodothermales bacterium]|nr:tetratricopeptide repeat protein [Rhodothermales bacterium]
SALRVAVLPLINISPDAEDAYFAAGMTEELVSRLSRLSGLRVIGRTSVMRYADTDRPIAEIGQALDVSAVLDGSVRKAGDDVRISVQLLDAASGVALWSEDYDAEAADALAVQRAIAEQVAAALLVQMKSGEQHRLAKYGTDVQEAYELYLKGRYFVDTWDEASVIKGRNALQQAVDLDPAFAEAWAVLADAYKVLDYLAVLSPDEAGPRIRAAAERALTLDPELAAAHAALALVLIDYYSDWETAGHHHRRAVELDPGSASSLTWYAEYLRDLGRFDEALEMIEKAQAADPLSPWPLMVEGIILDFARRPEEALVQYERLLEMHPNYRIAHFYAGLANVQLARYEVVLAEMDRIDPERTFPDAMGLRGLALAAMGREAEARAVLDELEALSEKRYVAPFLKALVALYLGEMDRALDLFEETIGERSWFIRIYNVAPPLDPVRSHPRFQALLERIGMET